LADWDRDRRRVERRTEELKRAFGTQLRQDRTDANVTQTALAIAADMSRSHLCGIELGKSEASLLVMASLADALGADLVLRMRPGTGPRIRDRVQSRIIEELIRIVHPRWQRFLEVPVVRPSRGVIDLVLHDQTSDAMVAAEIQSEIRRLEQSIRWANLKREALPSSDLWSMAAHAREPAVHGLLVLHATRSNRELAERFRLQFATVYPAKATDAYQALTTPDARWPGSAVLWASVDGDTARILERPPRGVSLGR
jgi:transcriptional regulator with XRE-family HTH domain